MVQTHTWNVQVGVADTVTCWRCNGTTPESYAFPAGTVCGQGVAAGWPYLSQPTCGGNDCTNPTGTEGSEVCIDGFKHTCTGGTWVEKSPQEACGGAVCAGQTTQAGCESAGCYWYSYPNPFGEPACFDKPIYIQYLPIIAVGIGAIIVLAALLGGRKQSYPPPYYPPPYYPPPPQYPPPQYPPR